MFDIHSQEFKTVIIGLITLVILLFLLKVKMILLPFILGALLAYMFNPFIEMLKHRDFSREGALLILVIIIFNLLLLSGLFIFPLMIDELQSLAGSIPQYIGILEDGFEKILADYERIDLPELVQESIDRFLQQLENYIIEIIQRITEYLLNSLFLLFSLILAPIVTYYLLRDIEQIEHSLFNYLPALDSPVARGFREEVNEVFVGYLRGQLWVTTLVGIFTSLGLYLLGVRFYIILGIFAGLTNIVPYFGPIIGGIPAVLIAGLSSPVQAFGVLFVYFLIQQVESSLLAPRILSKNVGLHPLTIIFSLLAGAELAGVWGMVFAIPVAGCIKVIIRTWYLPGFVDF